MSQQMSRRTLVRGLAACVCCTPVAAIAGSDDHKDGGHGPAHWAYEGNEGPQNWGNLSPEFRACQLGQEQTPIDLINGVKAEVAEKLVIAYKGAPARVINNGHTIQVNVPPGSALIIGDKRYELLQFHFHHPSEHLLSGKAFDLECHFVHKSAAGELAVLGVFIKPGATNSGLESIFQVMPAKAGGDVALNSAVDFEALLPADRAYFRYAGSLTTPPCSEGLVWTVMKAPIEADSAQIRRFAQLFANSARPLQARGRRFLLDVAG